MSPDYFQIAFRFASESVQTRFSLGSGSCILHSTSTPPPLMVHSRTTGIVLKTSDLGPEQPRKRDHKDSLKKASDISKTEYYFVQRYTLHSHTYPSHRYGHPIAPGKCYHHARTWTT